MTGRAKTTPRAAALRLRTAAIAFGGRVACASLRRLIAASRLCQMLIIAAVGFPVSAGDGIAGSGAASGAQVWLGPNPPSDVERPALVGNPIAAVPLDRLSATRDRPLFSPSRRHAVTAQPAPIAPRIEQVPRPPPVQSPSVALFGIVVSAQGPRAFIGMGPTNPIVGVGPGDDVNGWKVTAITQRSLVLSRADLSATFMLFSPENTSRIAHFDSAAPGQQVQRTPDDTHRRVRIR
jgi:general secretion pathway protein N